MTDAVAKEAYQESQRRQEDPSVILIERGILTSHIVSSIQVEVQRALGPKTIGGFRIISKLGQGGMGVVYKAVQVSVNREVALKVLGDQLGNNQEFADRFLREAHAAARVNHPNVITIYDAGSEGSLLYMAMEYVSGGDADCLMRTQGGCLSQRRAVEIIRDAARGLTAVHRAGLIHRDIKPANIFIGEDGTAKLADLGLSRQEAGDDRMTMTGAIMGTPAYMAPEQADGATDLDIRLDIYSLGATLYALLVGHSPFNGNSPYAVVAKVLNDPFPDPRQETIGLDDELAEIILLATRKDRNERYQNPKDLADALDAVVGRLPDVKATMASMTLMPPVRPPSTAHAGKRATTKINMAPTVAAPEAAKKGIRPAVIAAIAAVVLILLGGGAWLMVARGQAAERERLARERVAAEQIQAEQMEVQKKRDAMLAAQQEQERAAALTQAQAAVAARQQEAVKAEQARKQQAEADAEAERIAAEQARKQRAAEAAERAAKAEQARKEELAAEELRTHALLDQIAAIPDNASDADLDQTVASLRTFTLGNPSAANRTAVETALANAQTRVLHARSVRRQAEDAQRRVLSAVTDCSDDADETRVAIVAATVSGWLATKPSAELTAPVEAAWKAKQAACAASQQRAVEARKQASQASQVAATTKTLTQQDWGSYQNNMNRSFARSQELQGTSAIEAWKKFLATYQTDNPTTDEDDQMREKVAILLEEATLIMPVPAKLYADAHGQVPVKPAWASAFDKDAYGWYADVAVEKSTLRLRWCPAGTFLMGSRDGESSHHADERLHRVTLTKAFWISDAEVSQALWRDVCGFFSINPSRFIDKNNPVEQVSIDQCQDFFKDLNKAAKGMDAALPTEAQWEYACRAGTKTIYAGPLTNLGWMGLNGNMVAHPIRGRAANAWGIYDMHGNVAEWCGDTYADYPSEAVTDPFVTGGSEYVCRGGSWSDGDGFCRSAARNRFSPQRKSEQIGFRIAAPAKTAAP